MESAAYTAHVDGGARGNPGPAGYGLVIHDPLGKEVAELSQYLGHQTNNYAEYNGLLAALRYAVAHKIQALKIISDSELMVRQMKGIYKVRHPELRKLYDEAQRLTAQIEHVEIRHALREHNQDADRLANEAMDRGKHSARGEAEPHMRSEFAAKARAGDRAGADAERGAATRVGPAARREFEGIVRNGVIELLDGTLPEGTKVDVRARR
ncbi:MAG: ribonuclease HI family protein [Terriglobales bacterium]|jgi:probable phosphoglycerate mutase